MIKKFSKTKVKSNNLVIYLLFAIFILILIVLFINNKKICENFINETIMASENTNDKKKVIYYYMDGCGYCDQFSGSGVWEKLDNDIGKVSNVEFKKINIADKKDDINRYNIAGFPSIIATDKNDNKISEYQGDRSYESLKKYIFSFTMS
jgi:thioredoxin-related protein